MKRIFTTLFSVLLIAVFAFSSFAALAEDTETIDIEQIKEICTRLPNEKTVKMEHKDDILTAKKAYDAMDTEQKLALGSENIAKISVAYDAFIPLLMTDVVARIEQLPEKAEKADKDTVTVLWEDFSLLTTDAKESVNKKLVKKLKTTVKAVDSSLLSEEDLQALQQEEQKAKEEEEAKNAQAGAPAFHAWEVIVLGVLAMVILFNIVMIVVVAVKIFSANKRV